MHYGRAAQLNLGSLRTLVWFQELLDGVPRKCKSVFDEEHWGSLQNRVRKDICIHVHTLAICRIEAKWIERYRCRVCPRWVCLHHLPLFERVRHTSKTWLVASGCRAGKVKRVDRVRLLPCYPMLTCGSRVDHMLIPNDPQHPPPSSLDAGFGPVVWRWSRESWLRVVDFCCYEWCSTMQYYCYFLLQGR